jgi:hypothetical protein
MNFLISVSRHGFISLLGNCFSLISCSKQGRSILFASSSFCCSSIRGELDAVLARPRYGRSQMAGNEERAGIAGHRPSRELDVNKFPGFSPAMRCMFLRRSAASRHDADAGGV